MKIFDYIEFFEVSGKVVGVIVLLFFAMQLIVEMLKAKGVVAAEIVSIRTRIQRKKEAREQKEKDQETIRQMAELLPTLKEVPAMLKSTGEFLGNVERHYSDDNIRMRDDWIKNVNQKLEDHDELMQFLVQTANENSENIRAILIESKRSAIIDFASKTIDPNVPVTRAEFNRIFRIHNEYEEIINKHKIKNGEVDMAIDLIRESYEEHMRKHTFLEDVRGFTSKE